MKRFDAKHLTIHKGYLRFKRKYCHRLIWTEDVGPIPEGFDIHHKDGNKLNNLLNNLECLSKSDHMKLHAIETSERRSRCMSKNSDKLHAWLKTERGIEFLSEKAKKEWDIREERDFTCSFCQKPFKAKHTSEVKFCGDNCVARARRASGVDNEERTCCICSKPFIINRYQLTKTCSKPCRAKLISNLKRKLIT